MNNLQIAIIYASAIGSILNEWSLEESNRATLELRAQIKKFMFKRSRTNTKEFMAAIAQGDVLWSAAIEHFKDDNLQIEAVSTVVAIWSEAADSLARFANLTQKRVDRFAMLNQGQHTLEVEQNAYKVADFLTGLIKGIK